MPVLKSLNARGELEVLLVRHRESEGAADHACGLGRQSCAVGGHERAVVVTHAVGAQVGGVVEGPAADGAAGH